MLEHTRKEQFGGGGQTTIARELEWRRAGLANRRAAKVCITNGNYFDVYAKSPSRPDARSPPFKRARVHQPGVKVWRIASHRVMFHTSTCEAMRPSVPRVHVMWPRHGAMRGCHGSLSSPVAV